MCVLDSHTCRSLSIASIGEGTCAGSIRGRKPDETSNKFDNSGAR